MNEKLRTFVSISISLLILHNDSCKICLVDISIIVSSTKNKHIFLKKEQF